MSSLPPYVLPVPEGRDELEDAIAGKAVLLVLELGVERPLAARIHGAFLAGERHGRAPRGASLSSASASPSQNTPSVSIWSSSSTSVTTSGLSPQRGRQPRHLAARSHLRFVDLQHLPSRAEIDQALPFDLAMSVNMFSAPLSNRYSASRHSILSPIPSSTGPPRVAIFLSEAGPG